MTKTQCTHLLSVLSFLCAVSHDSYSFFFFNDTATTEIYTLSLHDALPISSQVSFSAGAGGRGGGRHALYRELRAGRRVDTADRKSTRLNSSHVRISYAVFCLKKKKNNLHGRCLNDAT